MASSRKIRTAIKKLLEPVLLAEGFTGKYPHFQRKEGGKLQLLSLLYDKWGGGFVLEFACHATGDLETAWGEVIPEANIEIGYTAPSSRARLVNSDSGQGLYEDFFRYEQFADNREQCEQLVSRVVELLPQVNAWLRNNQVGGNITPFSS